MAQTLDPAALQRLRDDLADEAAVRDILRSYIEEAPALLRALRQGLEARDAAAVAGAAHTLKSMSASVGALGLADLALALETPARSGDLGGAPALAARLDAAWPGVAALVAAAAGA